MRQACIRALAFGLAGILSFQAAAAEQSEAPTPLINAHAHNDYQHSRPLFDALSHGFCSVEADVFLVDGQLLVGHTPLDLKPQRTLQALYLDPLRTRIQENGGQVYRNGPPCTLLIDVKTDAEGSYAALRKVLESYADILTSVSDGKVQQKAITVIISGERAEQTIAADSTRYAGIDGRLSDLGSARPSHLLPWISCNWQNQFRWRGQGPMPEEERKKLRAIVQQAHQEHRRVRFWATTDRPEMWKELVSAGVDVLNADDLAGLERFLLKGTEEYPSSKPATQ